MAKSLMVDLETLSTSPNAVILTLGAVHFDPQGNGINNQLYMRIDIDAQQDLGREVDDSTLEWWQKQDKEIMEEAFSPYDRLPLEEAVDKFHKFAWGCDRFWSHGSIFDIMILENLYRQLNRTPPWNYFHIRDTRTLFDIGYEHQMNFSGKHNALQDAIRQAIGVQNVYAQLRGKK